MRFSPLNSVLEEAGSLLDLAARLGAVCQSSPKILVHLEKNDLTGKLAAELEGQVRAVDPSLLADPGPEGNYSHLLSVAAVRDCVEEVEAHNPIEHLAFLRGLLPALQAFYDDFHGRIELVSGMPLPLAARPYTNRFPRTPALAAAKQTDLLKRPGFYLFGPGDDDRWPIVLDYRFRDRLDQLTWEGEPDEESRLPKIATIHPSLGEDGIELGEVVGEHFFGVRPKNWHPDAVLAQLREVADEVEIAVLPELSLPAVDAIEEALAVDPGGFPPIVIAGSAHVRSQDEDGEELRANESRIYLDGTAIGNHRKIHPVTLHRGLDGERLERPLIEGLTSEPKPITVFCGEFTRLAVLICADANDHKLYGLLGDAGVNLLLVPALTPDPGGFNGSICAIASQCQGVSVIVNADTEVFRGYDSPPFLVMVGLPRSASGEQSEQFPPPPTKTPCIGIVDPNEEMSSAFRWWAASE